MSLLFDERSTCLPTSYDAYMLLDRGVMSQFEVAEFLEIREAWRRPVWYRNVKDVVQFIPDLVIDAILLGFWL